MTSYLKETYDTGLPSIHRTGLVDPHITQSRRELHTLHDGDRVVRFSSTTPGGVYDPPSSHPHTNSYYPRPPSPTANRKHVMELHDQVNLFKDELNKKDQLISQLTSLSNTSGSHSFRGFDSGKIEEIYAVDRIAASAAAKSEVAGLQVRVEGLQSQLREAQGQLDVREVKIRELKLHIETGRENESKQMAMVHSLREQLVQVQAATGNLESAASRGEVAIHTFQKQNKDAQDRILELESRVRTHLEEREHAEQKFGIVEKKYNDLIIHLNSIFRTDMEGSSLMSTEVIIGRLTDIVQGNALLKGKLLTMKEYLANAEVESKASRETIVRLVSEAERGQSITTRWNVELEGLRVERDNAVGRQRDLEMEIASLKERIESSTRAFNVTRQELERHETHASRLDRQAWETSCTAKNYETQLKAFKEQLAGMLTDSYVKVEPYEESIRDRVRHLQMFQSDRGAHVEMLENKVSSLTDQLAQSHDRVLQAERHAERSQSDVLQIEERLRHAEGELSNGSVLRDGMRSDKERFLRFMERVSHAMRMDKIVADIGYDLNGDAIIARAEQLAGRDSDDLVDRQTHIHNLQRKLKSFKEQLESKDLHMDLLRKKLTTLEEKLVGRTELERERDSDILKVRKLHKVVDRYQAGLVEAKSEITDLKARLLQSTSIKAAALEQERELENLENQLGHLENVREKQARKIANLKGEVDVNRSSMDEKRNIASNTVHALSSELRTTKSALEELQRRERQLLDLRAVIARMLGLDIHSLAVPDYELISRLEQLIVANQSNAFATVSLETAMQDVDGAFRSGYETSRRDKLFGSTMVRSRTPTRTTRTRVRTRSLSPKRRDVRAY